MCPAWNVRSPHSASSWRHDPFPWLFAELHPGPPMHRFPNSRICYLQVRGFFSGRRPEKSGTPVCGSTPRRSTPVPLAGILQYSLRDTPVLPKEYSGDRGSCGKPGWRKAQAVRHVSRSQGVAFHGSGRWAARRERIRENSPERICPCCKKWLQQGQEMMEGFGKAVRPAR